MADLLPELSVGVFPDYSCSNYSSVVMFNLFRRTVHHIPNTSPESENNIIYIPESIANSFNDRLANR